MRKSPFLSTSVPPVAWSQGSVPVAQVGGQINPAIRGHLSPALTLVRLHEFLTLVNLSAAARTVQSLTVAQLRLLENPRIGERLDEFEPREVRRILVGHYEMRYEVQESTVYVLRLWHTREDR